jgi:hypothetical protein
MLQLFYLDVTYVFTHMLLSVCPRYFICFKCMLYSSVSCCKCRPLALLSMRAGSAKPRLPTRGGGARRRRRCGEEAQGAWCCCKRGRDESFGRTGIDGRRAGVEEGGDESSEQWGQWIWSGRFGYEHEKQSWHWRSEQPRTSKRTRTSERQDASTAVCISHSRKRTASPHAD